MGRAVWLTTDGRYIRLYIFVTKDMTPRCEGVLWGFFVIGNVDSGAPLGDEPVVLPASSIRQALDGTTHEDRTQHAEILSTQHEQLEALVRTLEDSVTTRPFVLRSMLTGRELRNIYPQEVATNAECQDTMEDTQENAMDTDAASGHPGLMSPIRLTTGIPNNAQWQPTPEHAQSQPRIALIDPARGRRYELIHALTTNPNLTTKIYHALDPDPNDFFLALVWRGNAYVIREQLEEGLHAIAPVLGLHGEQIGPYEDWVRYTSKDAEVCDSSVAGVIVEGSPV